MPNLYTPDKQTIGTLLSMTSPPIVVPDWQRNYSWTSSEVDTFWHDLISFNEHYPGDNIADQEYFLGSIVIVNNNVSHLLLDGQQRLATAAILVSVVRDFLSRYSKDAAIRISTRYLTDYDDTLADNIYKITLNRYDRDFFRREILETRDTGYVAMTPTIESHRQIRKAREFFEEKFESKYGEIDDQQQAHQWALRILKVLTNHISLVAVISSDEDNAANVFETLNDRGIGLSTPDLLRNLIFRRANANDLEEIIDLWGEILGIESDTKLKAFLRHYWISHQGDVKTRSLYHEIKAHVQDTNENSLEFSRSLRDASVVYQDIISARDENEETSGILSDIRSLGANALYPAILSAYECGGPTDIYQLLQALLTTYVRHNVIGGRENSLLETNVYSLASNLRESRAFSSSINALITFSPDDDQFKTSFATAIISRQATARVILEHLEQDARATGELTVATPRRVHVEHIYPQTPRVGERLPNHSEMIDRLGNLTLLSARLNQGARNAPFDDKKPFYEQSELLITNVLSENAKWDAEEIDRRQRLLAERAPTIWRFPEI